MNARYTLTLEDILKSGYKLKSLELYPIFSEEYRQTLNMTIINFYSFYEIAFETIEMFDSRLYSKLLLIMPYYNKLYELELSVKNIGIENIFKNRFDTTENATNNFTGNVDSVGTSKKTGDDTLSHGLVVDYNPMLKTVSKTDYNSDDKTIFGHTKITDDDREITNTSKNLGGKNITENATLLADTPQNNSPISNNTGGGDFDSFNNSVFQINGYLSKADKSLNINESFATNENTQNVKGDLNEKDVGTNSLEKRGDDTVTTDNTGYSKTTNSGDDITKYNSLVTDNNNTNTHNNSNNKVQKFGNDDFIKSITDLRESFFNIEQMIIRDIRDCFLSVF